MTDSGIGFDTQAYYRRDPEGFFDFLAEAKEMAEGFEQAGHSESAAIQWETVALLYKDAATVALTIPGIADIAPRREKEAAACLERARALREGAAQPTG